MSDLLVLGVGPLPHDESSKLFATGLRVWQMTTALAAAGHRITLVATTFGEQATAKEQKADNRSMQDVIANPLGVEWPLPNVQVRRMKYHAVDGLDMLRTFALAGRFDAIISSTDIMNDLAARVREDVRLPLWLDYFGDPFAEKQMQAVVYRHDGSLRPQWDLYFTGLSTGDRFSVCSQSQKMAMIGELGFAGRLNSWTSGEELVHVLPGTSRALLDVAKKVGPNARPLAVGLPSDAFVILWTGGYNTWCDVDILWHGLSAAMDADPRIHYVSTGGSLDGHDSESAKRFHELAKASPHSDRIHFHGWVATRDIPQFYKLADLAINIDRVCYEGELGTRNRLVDWLLFQVPIASTVTCDFASELAERDLIRRVESGEARSLTQAILAEVAGRDRARQRAEAALRWFDTAYPESSVFSPLTEWAAQPKFAADRVSKDQPMPLLVARHYAAMRGEIGAPKKSFFKRLLGKVVGK